MKSSQPDEHFEPLGRKIEPPAPPPKEPTRSPTNPEILINPDGTMQTQVQKSERLKWVLTLAEAYA